MIGRFNPYISDHYPFNTEITLKRILIYLLLWAAPLCVFAQQKLSLDFSFNYGQGSDFKFNTGSGANEEVYAIQPLNDGKLLIGGRFSTYNGVTRNKLARISEFGVLDQSFNVQDGPNDYVRSIANLPDGKVMVAGEFTSFNGANISYLARLNANGSVDNTFNAGAAGANDYIVSVKTTPNGKLIIAGGFSSYNGKSCYGITRLNADGSLDNTFKNESGADGIVKAFTVLPNGKIVLVGDFSTYNKVKRNKIARLNADGSLDNEFVIGAGADATVNSLVVQPDGKILVAGFFSTIDTIQRSKIARLNTDGSIDRTFNPLKGADLPIYAMQLLPSGKIVIGGDFINFNDVNRSRIARLNSDGSLDNDFQQGTGADYIVNNLLVLPSGALMIAGDFNQYDKNTRSKIARLNANGSVETRFNGVLGTDKPINFAVTSTVDKKLIIVGDFNSYNGKPVGKVARLNADGSLDDDFKTGTGANAAVQTATIQTDGKIILAGNFTKFNGIEVNKVVRLNMDGSIDYTFNKLGTGANFEVFAALFIPLGNSPYGSIVLAGNFTTFNGKPANKIVRLTSDGSIDPTFLVTSGANAAIRALALTSSSNLIVVGDFTTFNGTPCGRIVRLNSDGTVDKYFKTDIGADDNIRTVAINGNGKILIGGSFNNYQNSKAGKIARLMEFDGALDKSFISGEGANEPIRSIFIAGGDIIVGGDFTTFNGAKRNHIAVLSNLNGTLDKNVVIGNGFNKPVRTITYTSDIRLFVGGEFTYYQSQSTPFGCKLDITGRPKVIHRK